MFKASGPDAAVPGRLLLENLGTANTLVGRDGDKCLCQVNVTIEQIEALAHINVAVEEGAVTLGVQALHFPVNGAIQFVEAKDSESQFTDAIFSGFLEWISLEPDNSSGRWVMGKRGAIHATEPSWFTIRSTGLPSLSDAFDVLKIDPQGRTYLLDNLTMTRDDGLDTPIGFVLVADNGTAQASAKVENVLFRLDASNLDYGALSHQGIEVLWWIQSKVQTFVPLELPGNPTEDLHAIPKQYVDKWAVETVTDDYSIVPGEDHVVLIDAATKTVTLPDAATSEGQHYKIKLIAAATTGTVDTDGGDIDGSASYSLSAQWKYVEVVSNGTDWMIVANN